MKVNQETYALVFKHLLTEEASAHELADVSGLHSITVQSLMRTLKKYKVVHVCGWDKDGMGRDTTPIYKLGVGKNVSRTRMTRAQVVARYRAKKKHMDEVKMIFKGATHGQV
jgi:predicted ArsR family transcriptional regulator